MNKTHKFQQNQKSNNMKIDTFYFIRLKPKLWQFLKTLKFLVKKNRTYARKRLAVEDGKWNGMEFSHFPHFKVGSGMENIALIFLSIYQV